LGFTAFFCLHVFEGLFACPLYFTSFSDIPIVEVEIEKKKHLLKIDLGATGDLFLQKRALDKIRNKEEIGTIQHANMFGRIASNNLFKIFDVQIEEYTFTNPIVSEENPEFYMQNPNSEPSDRHKRRLAYIDGRIGRGILASSDCFIDLPHATFFLNAEKQKEHLTKGFLELPLEIHDTGLMICVTTDLGTKKLVLDTGAFISFLRKPSNNSLKTDSSQSEVEHKSCELMIGDQNFGPWEFFFLENMTPLLEADGILGVDFFNKHAVYLDIHEQKIYIQRPSWRLRLLTWWNELTLRFINNPENSPQSSER
jgi:hypothetical protein